MSSRRTRKSSRSRTQKQLNPLSQIFGPAPTKGYLAPIKSAKGLVKKAADLINAGTELPKPTSAQERKRKILQRIAEKKEQKKQQIKF